MFTGPNGWLELSNTEFSQLSRFIYDRWGINLPPTKRQLLEGRLRKRLSHLQMTSFQEYCSYLFSPAGIESEAPLMIDLVTTNKTEFFREADHFEYLAHTAVPDLRSRLTSFSNDQLRVWSAGCSSGEEPYTLAMVLNECRLATPGLRVRILATDISSRMLSVAREGIYPESRIEPIPLEWRHRYLLRSKDPSRHLVRFVPTLREMITFHRLNLMEIAAQVRDTFHVIFCRNVIIYFDKPTQEKVIRDFHQRLTPGGYLFLGHSETLTGMNLPFLPVAPTVYRKI
ncbi:MAG TPA: protein-glutamate O-methyltransferase [Candidatus Ozemobacteraceae bacterium]